MQTAHKELIKLWGDVIQKAREQKPPLAGKLKHAVPVDINHEVLTIAFHQTALLSREYCEKPNISMLISQLVHESGGGNVEIQTTLFDTPYDKMAERLYQQTEQPVPPHQVSESNTTPAIPERHAGVVVVQHGDVRKKFAAEYRTADGHYVRSRAEVIIDNWLYHSGIVHSYEKRLPIQEDVFSDFYLPQWRIYVEFWGYKNDSKYLSRKKAKQELYKKYGLSLLELNDDDIHNIDDAFPEKLFDFGIRLV